MLCFSSKGHIYVWYQLSHLVSENNQPNDLDSILDAMIKKGMRALKQKEVRPVMD